MNCSIVIRAYNEEKHIGRLLEGIKQQTLKDVEVILVDSGSTDSTVAIAES
jgi:glycosyltransferase involved in cell wall biosynthesis